MLIRIADHFRNNPKRIDKLIAIVGLPKEWLFIDGPEGTELRRPWRPDIDANIPLSIQHLCEPMYVTFRYAPMERGAKEVIERRQILGVKLDYNTEPGREMWDQVERYMEESMPRSERIPVPVVCAKDEHSAFETYTPRRSATGSLELTPSQVPLVDLTKFVQVTIQPTIQPQAVPPRVESPIIQPPAASFVCEVCSVAFAKAQALRMHKMKKHPKQEKVGAS